MARPTRGTIASYAGNSATPTVSVVCGGTGTRGLRIYVQWRDPGVADLTSVVRDGQTATLVGAKYDGGGWNRAVYDIDDPNANTSDLVVTLSSARDTRVIAFPYSDMDSAGRWGAITSELDLSAAYGSTVTADQELLSIGGVVDFTADAQTFTSDGTGQTEINDARVASQYASAAYQQETGTVTASYTFSDPANIWESGILLFTANGATALAPTVTVQPTAQTARVNGESAATATFTSTATGTGTVDATTEIEDGVASGVYGTLANGSGATWSGLTGTGSGTATATPVGTFTAETLNGRRIRIKFDDDNGTTYSNAVALTVYTGPVLSTYSGTGAGTIDLSGDEVLGTGYSYRVTVTPTGYASAAKRSHGRGV